MSLSDSLLTPNFSEVTEFSPTESKIVLEPLERGFGHTLGNSLRRILLSSIEGAAVTIVKIDGVLHEYSTIDGVQEDVIDILLNIKELAFKFDDSVEEATATIEVKGPCEISGLDIKVPHSGELLNPNVHIANISADINLKMELIIKKGRGIETAAERKKLKGSQIGELHLDSYFSPVHRVSYQVDSARQGNRTDLDKLTIELETNGTIHPKQAISKAAEILHHQLSAFVDIDEQSSTQTDGMISSVDKVYLTSVDDLGLTVRSLNCLKNENIHYLGDLVRKSPNELLKISNFGQKSLDEIKAILTTMNLDLGTMIEGWPPQDIAIN